MTCDIRYAPAGLELPFPDDVQRQNWLWLLDDGKASESYIAAVGKTFGDAQRKVMLMPPMDAAIYLKEILPERITDDVMARAEEAQARLFPPLIAWREDNVVAVNFRRHRA